MTAVAQLPFAEKDSVVICGAAPLDDGGCALAGEHWFDKGDDTVRECFVTRLDKSFAIAGHAIVGGERDDAVGVYVDGKRVIVTTQDNRAIEGKKKATPGPFLRSGPWSIVKIVDEDAHTGACGTAYEGVFVLCRGDALHVVALLNKKYDDQDECKHPPLRGKLGAPLVVEDNGFDEPRGFWLRGLHDLDGKRALLTILSAYATKRDPFHHLVVDDKGKVKAKLDLRGEIPYDKSQLDPVVDRAKKRIIVKTAKAVHVFGYDGERKERTALPAGLGGARAITWANGFVLSNEAGRVLVRADDVEKTSLADAASAMRNAAKAK